MGSMLSIGGFGFVGLQYSCKTQMVVIITKMDIFMFIERRLPSTANSWSRPVADIELPPQLRLCYFCAVATCRSIKEIASSTQAFRRLLVSSNSLGLSFNMHGFLRYHLLTN